MYFDYFLLFVFTACKLQEVKTNKRKHMVAKPQLPQAMYGWQKKAIIKNLMADCGTRTRDIKLGRLAFYH